MKSNKGSISTSTLTTTHSLIFWHQSRPPIKFTKLISWITPTKIFMITLILHSSFIALFYWKKKKKRNRERERENITSFDFMGNPRVLKWCNLVLVMYEWASLKKTLRIIKPLIKILLTLPSFNLEPLRKRVS